MLSYLVVFGGDRFPEAMSASTDPMDGMVEALSVSGDGGRSGLQGGQELAETNAIGSLDEDQAIL